MDSRLLSFIVLAFIVCVSEARRGDYGYGSRSKYGNRSYRDRKDSGYSRGSRYSQGYGSSSSKAVQYPRCHKGKTLLDVLVLDKSGMPVANADVIKADDRSFFKKNSTEKFQTDNSGKAKFYALGCQTTLIISKNLTRIHHEVNLKNCKTSRKKEIVVLDNTLLDIRDLFESEIDMVLDAIDNITGPSCGSCRCGLAKRKNRIIGGEETEINEYPWMAVLTVLNGETRFFTCGGSLISDWWILTAAHCVVDLQDRYFQVSLGDHDRKTSAESMSITIDVTEVHIHPDYGNDNDILDVNNDFALLKLKTPIAWGSNSHIRPICLPSVYDEYDTYEAIATGWGLTKSPSLPGPRPSPADKLQEVKLTVISNEECDIKWLELDPSGDIFVTEEMICAGDPLGGKDICRGDSGGPLITTQQGHDGVTPGQNYELIGVSSWTTCAHELYPGVYARVTEAMDWIIETTHFTETACPR